MTAIIIFFALFSIIIILLCEIRKKDQEIRKARQGEADAINAFIFLKNKERKQNSIQK